MCVGLLQKGVSFGLAHNTMLGDACIQPQSRTISMFVQVTDTFHALVDKLVHASQVAPLFLLCGDLNTKVGGLNKVTHAHRAHLVAHPALQLER